ncbi:MAG: thioredoxin family protein [Pseudomonadota bacterium]
MKKKMPRTIDYIDAEISHADRPVVLEFHDWYFTPCITQARRLVRASVHSPLPAQVIGVNVEEAPRIADRYAVSTVPSIVPLRDSKIVARFTGLADAGNMISALEADQIALA